MRDDSHKWDAPRDQNASLSAAGATVTQIFPTRQILVSGPTVRSQTDLPLVTWPEIAAPGPLALSLRRDRVLLVDGPAMINGWDADKAQAISDVTDGYDVFEISGPSALDALRRGAALDLSQPSQSVARLVFGLGVFLYRIGDENRYRIHVARAQSEALFKHLTAALAEGDA